MAPNRFSMGEAISFGWSTMKSNLGLFIGVLIIAGVITAVIPALLPESPAVDILSTLVDFVITMGFIRIALKFCDGEKAEFGDLFSCFHLLLKYAIGLILYVIVVTIGLILLIIPGIILAIKFSFFSYFIVDQEQGPIEALKNSSAITKGAKLDLFLFFLLLGLINLAGVLALGIGLFATVPTTMVAVAFVYRRLLAATSGVEGESYVAA